jgi:hypothetical protein
MAKEQFGADGRLLIDPKAMRPDGRLLGNLGRAPKA